MTEYIRRAEHVYSDIRVKNPRLLKVVILNKSKLNVIDLKKDIFLHTK